MTLQTDPILSVFILLFLSILFVGIIFKQIKQPMIVAYIIAGIFIGPYCLNLFPETDTITSLGNVGIIILLFFIGMEVNLKKLVSNWKVALLGTGFQIILSILFVYIISLFLNWDLSRIILLGFAISLSSTAVVMKILKEYKEINSKTGHNVTSILLTQDIAIVPMIITISFMSGNHIEKSQFILQIVGAFLVGALLIYLVKKENIKLPFSIYLRKNHELQVFFSLVICFGFGIITGFFGLSTALGAFIAGIFIRSCKETKWIISNLHSLYVILVALFFISIGMLFNLEFIASNIITILLLVFGVFITNILINAFILRLLNNSLKESLYGGTLLSEIGELSFVLIAVAFNLNIIGIFDYNMTVSIIALTLLLSPLLINITRGILKISSKQEKFKNTYQYKNTFEIKTLLLIIKKTKFKNNYFLKKL